MIREKSFFYDLINEFQKIKFPVNNRVHNPNTFRRFGLFNRSYFDGDYSFFDHENRRNLIDYERFICETVLRITQKFNNIDLKFISFYIRAVSGGSITSMLPYHCKDKESKNYHAYQSVEHRQLTAYKEIDCLKISRKYQCSTKKKIHIHNSKSNRARQHYRR